MASGIFTDELKNYYGAEEGAFSTITAVEIHRCLLGSGGSLICTFYRYAKHHYNLYWRPTKSSEAKMLRCRLPGIHFPRVICP